MAKTPKKKKNQLPSGSYRVQVYSHTDANGKRHYKSFTAPSKKLARAAANDWLTKHDSKEQTPENLTVYDAVTRYITLKKGVLSPATIKEYIGMQKRYFTGTIGNMKLEDVRSQDIQLWISDLSGRLSSKTVRNVYGLLVPTLAMFAPDLRLRITLPQRERTELYCPSDDDIKTLLHHIQGKELEIAVLLAAFGPLRRSEICALTDKDIEGNKVKITKSLVQDSDGFWVIKNHPKTYGGYREITLPEFVIKRLSGIEGKIIKCTPDQISDRFKRAVIYSGVPHFRFHDLRHYAASIMHAIGVPDQYIMQRGGWSSDNVMKTVYRNVIDLEKEKQTKKINDHFSSLKTV
ncbi:MAG TPA: site-specific integrase [Candidatus Lachnoclostridium avicola]|nr:site-specific integrase [Candidatus Lachnoclostridium avicola]